MRPYVPLSVDFFGDDKVIELTPLARLEYAACLVIAKRQESDGSVTLAQVRREQPDVPDHQGLLAELVDSGLLSWDGGNTYAIVAWLEWNKSVEELAGMRQAKASAGKIGGKRSGEARSALRPKHSASPVRSTLLPEVEADGEPNTTHPTTPQLITSQEMSPSDSPSPSAPRLHPSTTGPFEEFYAAYPHKVAKGDARKAWAKAVVRAGSPQIVIDGARRLAADPNLPEKRFIPHPASWLNGDRWDDEPYPPRFARERPPDVNAEMIDRAGDYMRAQEAREAGAKLVHLWDAAAIGGAS